MSNGLLLVPVCLVFLVIFRLFLWAIEGDETGPRGNALRPAEPFTTEPFTSIAPQDRRGQYITLAVATCHRCLAEDVRPIPWDNPGYMQHAGMASGWITRVGWRRYGDTSVWLCPDCARQIDEIVREVVI